jgi:hypothetical protein
VFNCSPAAPRKPAACASAITSAQTLLDGASRASGAFSSSLKAHSTGPASGFAEVGALTKASADANRNVASAYDALAELSIDEYAGKLHAASSALRTASAQLDLFAAAATAYSVSDSPLNTVVFNSTAKGALNGPLDAATAINEAMSDYKALGGDVCR